MKKEFWVEIGIWEGTFKLWVFNIGLLIYQVWYTLWFAHLLLQNYQQFGWGRFFNLVEREFLENLGIAELHAPLTSPFLWFEESWQFRVIYQNKSAHKKITQRGEGVEDIVSFSIYACLTLFQVFFFWWQLLTEPSSAPSNSSFPRQPSARWVKIRIFTFLVCQFVLHVHISLFW